MSISPLQYLKIDDFSPGIWDPGISGYETNFRPVPIGAARLENTYRCIALPNGALAPLPSKTSTIAFPSNPPGGEIVRGGLQAIQVVGLGVFGNIIAQSGQLSAETPELHLMVNWTNTANNERFKWYYNDLSAPGWVLAVDKTVAGAFGTFGIQTPSVASIAHTYTTTGFPQPIMAVGWAGGAFGGGVPGILFNTHYRWWLPDPTGVNAAQEVSNANYVGYGFLYAHQSRVLALEYNYQNHILGTIINRNNNPIDYTDPPLTTTMGTQGTILSAEYAEGYGAIGSVSSGELFLVKKRGGAIIMYDDIDYPKVVRLPGVVSTGKLMQNGSFCSAGMLYAVEGSGMYAWDGSSASKNISPQLKPNFFMPISPSPTTVAPAGAGCYDTYIPHCPWGEYVAVSQGWVFNPSGGSWWRLAPLSVNPPSQNEYTWFTSIGPYLYACNQWNAGSGTIAVFDSRRPGEDFRWSSHAIPVSSGKQVSIREVEVEFTAFELTSSSVQIWVYDDAQVVTQLIFTPTTIGRPWRETKKLPIPVNAQHIQFDIISDGTSTVGAPIVHYVSIGYAEDRLVASGWS